MTLHGKSNRKLTNEPSILKKYILLYSMTNLTEKVIKNECPILKDIFNLVYHNNYFNK